MNPPIRPTRRRIPLSFRGSPEVCIGGGGECEWNMDSFLTRRDGGGTRGKAGAAETQRSGPTPTALSASSSVVRRWGCRSDVPLHQHPISIDFSNTPLPSFKPAVPTPIHYRHRTLGPVQRTSTELRRLQLRPHALAQAPTQSIFLLRMPTSPSHDISCDACWAATAAWRVSHPVGTTRARGTLRRRHRCCPLDRRVQRRPKGAIPVRTSALASPPAIVSKDTHTSFLFAAPPFTLGHLTSVQSMRSPTAPTSTAALVPNRRAPAQLPPCTHVHHHFAVCGARLSPSIRLSSAFNR